MVVAKYPATRGHTTVINNLCKGLSDMGYSTAIGAFSFSEEPPFNIKKVVRFTGVPWAVLGRHQQGTHHWRATSSHHHLGQLAGAVRRISAYDGDEDDDNVGNQRRHAIQHTRKLISG